MCLWRHGSRGQCCWWCHGSRGHCAPVKVLKFHFFIMNNNRTNIKEYTKANMIKTCLIRIYTETFVVATNSTVSDTFTMRNYTAYNCSDILSQRPWPGIVAIWLKPSNCLLGDMLSKACSATECWREIEIEFHRNLDCISCWLCLVHSSSSSSNIKRKVQEESWAFKGLQSI